MVRLWGVLKKKQKIVEDVVVETERADLDGAREAVDKCCYKLDIPRPLWLPKHESEIERFGRTIFLPEHFVETVSFDRFEVEFLREKGKSQDPRNDFSF